EKGDHPQGIARGAHHQRSGWHRRSRRSTDGRVIEALLGMRHRYTRTVVTRSRARRSTIQEGVWGVEVDDALLRAPAQTPGLARPRAAKKTGIPPGGDPCPT